MNTSELTHEHMRALEKLLPTKSPDYIDNLYLGAANYVHENMKYLSPHDEDHLVRMGEKAWPGLDVRSVLGGIRNGPPPRKPARPRVRPSRPLNPTRPARPQPRPAKSEGLPSYVIVIIVCVAVTIFIGLVIMRARKDAAANREERMVSNSGSAAPIMSASQIGKKPGMFSRFVPNWGSKKGTPVTSYKGEASRSGSLNDDPYY
jgi:hypothetical protein